MVLEEWGNQGMENSANADVGPNEEIRAGVLQVRRGSLYILFSGLNPHLLPIFCYIIFGNYFLEYFLVS